MTRVTTMKRTSLLFALLFGITNASLAAQLGRLNVISKAEEPFLAEIAVEAVTPAQESSLSAGLASVESFAAARLALDPELSKLSFKIVKDAGSGATKVLITSEQPLQPGFLDALVELSWAGGKIAREYTLTVPVRTETPAAPSSPNPPAIPDIRPPITVPKLTAPTVSKPEPAAPPVEPTPTQEPPRQTAAVEPVKTKPKVPALDLKDQTSTSIKVGKGDTLSDLALQMVGDGVTLNQAMAGIFQANQGAFINGSIHRLKEGATLQVPNRSVLRQNTRNQALVILALADDRNDFSAYARRIGLIDSVGQPTVALSTTNNTVPNNSSQGQIGQVVADVRGPTEERDSLKISPATGDQAAADALAEELTAKDKTISEANERIALLEQNISDLQRLIEMQNAAPPAGQPQIDAKPGDSVKVEESPELNNAMPSLSGEVPKVDLVEPKEEPKAAEEPHVESETGGLALMTSPWVIGGIGGLALLVLLALLWKLRRKDDQSEGESGFGSESKSQSPDSFDEALAWASTPTTAQEPAGEEEPSSSVSAVEDEVFDLDSVLEEKEQEETDVESIEENVQEEIEPEPEPAPKPEVTEPEPEVKQPAIEESMPEVDEEPLSGDVDLDFPEEPAQADDKASNSILDDLDDLEKGAAAAQAELDELRKGALTASEGESEEADANFDDIDELEKGEEPVEEEPEPEEVEDADVEKAMEDLDVDVPNEVDEATWQEVATKLDLASAYVEIGDAEGARELLEEIVSRGDVDQVRKAKEMLADLEP